MVTQQNRKHTWQLWAFIICDPSESRPLRLSRRQEVVKARQGSLTRLRGPQQLTNLIKGVDLCKSIYVKYHECLTYLKRRGESQSELMNIILCHSKQRPQPSYHQAAC